MKSRFLALITFCLVAPATADSLHPQAYGLLKSIYAYDRSYPLNARIAGSVQNGDHRFEKLVFDSFHDGKVTGLLGLPANGQAPYPLVLLLHGVTGNKSQWLEDPFTHGGEVSARLLARGYAVLALDAQYHGERAVYNDYLDVGEMVFQRGWGVRYANMLTQTVVDYRRAIDYAETREDLDDTRIGMLGYSMGGHMAFMLGAVDPRIRAIVACVVPDMPGMPMAASAFTQDLGGGPLLMLMASHDDFYTAEQAQALFDAVPGNDKTIEFYDSGHSLPPAYVNRAARWMSDNL